MTSAPAPSPLTDLGARLREARARRGWSQAQLASQAGLTRLRVIDIERGSTSVSMGAYAQAARSLGLRLALEPYRRPVFEELKDLFP
jgi:HTH-type transcriptional regulator/antitoxin HipB